ncbi:hypothetical protein Ahy_B03g066605 isoform A [Arachis hypogaea]|uniref:Uncharacterized protein n=1 Tax=Arachis hypogaea TaxID=3818 RepID=A0A445A4N3_ARAHY|nr:hypothetical protein Ahy_B03g066605 isoform A [Arachis hypogaea]
MSQIRSLLVLIFSQWTKVLDILDYYFSEKDFEGNQGYKDKQWQKVIGFYSEAIKLSSNNATYDSDRSQVYLELGSYLQAEA